MQKNSLVSKTILLAGIFVFGIAITISILYFSGQSRLSLEKLLSIVGYQINLRIKSDPIGSPVWINDNYYGITPLGIFLSPGSYIIKIQQDGYKPCEKEIVIFADEPLNITCNLFFKPTIAKISSTASALFWKPEGSLIYFNYGDMSFYQYSNGTTKAVQNTADMPSTITYLPTGNKIITSYQSEYFSLLTMINLKTSSIDNFEITGLPMWSSEDENLYVLSYDSQGGETLWRESGRSFKEVVFDGILTSNITNYWGSKGENILVFQSDNQLTYWVKKEKFYGLSKNKNDSYGIGWINNGEEFLSTDSDNHLCLTVLTNGALIEQCGKTKISFPLAISNNTKNIYFLTHNNDLGTEDLWMLDIYGDSTILIKSGINGIGLPIEMSVSPDEKQVAIINQFNDLLMLNLEKR